MLVKNFKFKRNNAMALSGGRPDPRSNAPDSIVASPPLARPLLT
jgi:hypothetical protein